MIGSCELKARVEESLGTVLDPDFFGQAEQYARRKLDMCNERAGRIYGEDGYSRPPRDLNRKNRNGSNTKRPRTVLAKSAVVPGR